MSTQVGIYLSDFPVSSSTQPVSGVGTAGVAHFSLSYMEIVSKKRSDLATHVLQVPKLVRCGRMVLESVHHVGEGGGPCGH